MSKLLDGVFNEYLLWHEWEQQSRPQTIRHHQLNFKKFIEYIKKSYPTDELTLEHFNEINIRNFLVHRLKNDGLSPRTVLGQWQDLKSFSNFLLKHEILVKDPMRNISRPKFDRKLPDALTEQQVKELFKFMLSRRKKRYRIAYLRDLALIGVFVFAGLRRGEALNLKIQDVDFENKLIHLTHTKTRREEVMPMCNSLKQLLEDYIKVRLTLKRYTDHVFVCSNRMGNDKRRGDGSFRTRGVQLLFQEINEHLNFGKKILPHLLRRSFATMLLRRGSNIVQVSRLLRHSSIDVTVKSYIGYSQEELMQAVERFHPLNIRF